MVNYSNGGGSYGQFNNNNVNGGQKKSNGNYQYTEI
jgi:hypothetical protein